MQQHLDQALAAMTADEKRGALIALDVLSRPLTPREIEALARRAGMSRTQACKLAGAIKGCAIIALAGPETTTEGTAQ